MNLIKPERNIEVPVSLGLRGLVTIKRRDMRSGMVDYVREEKPNMLLDWYLNRIFTSGTQAIIHHQAYGGYSAPGGSGADSAIFGPMRYCHIGSDATPTTRNMTALGNRLAGASASSQERSVVDAVPVWVEQTFVFGAGVGTGTIAEVGINVANNTNASMCARQVVSPAIDKNEYHQLEVTWRIELNRSADTFSGTILAGQRDGVSDVNWIATINNQQLFRIQGKCQANWLNHGNPFASLFGFNSYGNVYLRTATSNDPSVLTTDGHDLRKGTDLFAGQAPTLEPVAYVNGSYERTSRIGFDVQHTNGQIGEIVLRNWHTNDTSSNRGGMLRVAFAPHLDKIDSFRLFINFMIKINPS